MKKLLSLLLALALVLGIGMCGAVNAGAAGAADYNAAIAAWSAAWDKLELLRGNDDYRMKTFGPDFALDLYEFYVISPLAHDLYRVYLEVSIDYYEQVKDYPIYSDYYIQYLWFDANALTDMYNIITKNIDAPYSSKLNAPYVNAINAGYKSSYAAMTAHIDQFAKSKGLTNAQKNTLLAEAVEGMEETLLPIPYSIFSQQRLLEWAVAVAFNEETLQSKMIEAADAAIQKLYPASTYTLTYNANGGSGGPAAQSGIAAGTVVTLNTTNAPTRTGHTFKGWAATATSTAIITSVTVNANTSVFAVWEQNPAPTYTLTYNANGGSGGPAAQSGIAAGTVVTLNTANAPTRTGHTFKGWAASATSTAIITSVTVNANTSVFAVWQQNSSQQKGWQAYPSFLQFILRWFFFGFIWMRK